MHHIVDVLLKKGGALQTIAALAMDAPHEIYVLIRNVGEGNATVSLLAGTAGPTVMEPHSARLYVLAKGNVIQAQCSTADTYTVLLVEYRAGTPTSGL